MGIAIFVLTTENQPNDLNDQPVRNVIDETTWAEETANWNESTFSGTLEESSIEETMAEEAPGQHDVQQGEDDGMHLHDQVNPEVNGIVHESVVDNIQGLNEHSLDESIILVGEFPAPDLKPQTVVQGYFFYF